MLLSVLTFVDITPVASAATVGNNYTVTGVVLQGDQTTCDYGQGRFARSRYGGLTVSGTIRENNGVPENYVDYKLEWINPDTKSSTPISDENFTWDGDFEFEFDSMPASTGVNTFNTGYTTHYYDVSELWLTVIDENTEEDIRKIRIARVYILNRVA